MDETWREAFLSHARTRDYWRRVREAEDVIRGVLDSSQRPYVAFSGGKDSTVMAHLVLDQRPGVLVWHAWSIWRPPEVEAEIDSIAQALGVQRYRVVRGLGGRLHGQHVPRLLEEGHDRVFVGLRSEESGKRRRRIARRLYITDIPESWPLASWTWMDVWAYIVAHDLPYLSAYDQMAPLVGWDQARTSTFFDPTAVHGDASVDGVLFWRLRHQVGQQRGGACG